MTCPLLKQRWKLLRITRHQPPKKKLTQIWPLCWRKVLCWWCIFFIFRIESKIRIPRWKRHRGCKTVVLGLSFNIACSLSRSMPSKGVFFSFRNYHVHIFRISVCAEVFNLSWSISRFIFIASKQRPNGILAICLICFICSCVHSLEIFTLLFNNSISFEIALALTVLICDVVIGCCKQTCTFRSFEIVHSLCWVIFYSIPLTWSRPFFIQTVFLSALEHVKIGLKSVVSFSSNSYCFSSFHSFHLFQWLFLNRFKLFLYRDSAVHLEHHLLFTDYRRNLPMHSYVPYRFHS